MLGRVGIMLGRVMVIVMGIVMGVMQLCFTQCDTTNKVGYFIIFSCTKSTHVPTLVFRYFNYV